MPPRDSHSSAGSRPLFLIGYRGSGKTTVARPLAERLGWQWTDADALLEERQGRSIRRIFAEDGEAAFRAMEAELLVELCVRRRHVIATGGGVVLRPENRRLLKESGLVVWLAADAATLWERLRHDESTAQRRPNLTVGGLEEIEEMLAAREPWYAECAHLRLETANCAPAAMVDEILAARQAWMNLR